VGQRRGLSRESGGDVFGGGGGRGMKPPIQMRGCVSGMVESELRSVDVGPTPRPILGFHLRRSVRSADTTTCEMGVWDFHPQMLQMDTDQEVEGSPRGVSLVCSFGWPTGLFLGGSSAHPCVSTGGNQRRMDSPAEARRNPKDAGSGPWTCPQWVLPLLGEHQGRSSDSICADL